MKRGNFFSFLLLFCFSVVFFMTSCGTNSPIGTTETGNNSSLENIEDSSFFDSINGGADTITEPVNDSIAYPGSDTETDTLRNEVLDSTTMPPITQPDSTTNIIIDSLAVSDTIGVSDTISVSDTGSVADTTVITDETPEVQGQISWVLTSTGVPQDIVNRITAAMDAAVARYNRWGNWRPRTLTVEYNTGVATADGNINGNIRFGRNTSYMTECIAMHEIAHTYGVGTSPNWRYPLIQNGLFVGENALAKLREFDGPNAVLNTGGGHFWPYGLNFNREWSEINGDRHVQIVWAMMLDGLFWNY